MRRMMTVREQLESLGAHNAYHFGRIVLLRQLLGECGRRPRAVQLVTGLPSTLAAAVCVGPFVTAAEGIIALHGNSADN
jgi:hypothetical protein